MLSVDSTLLTLGWDNHGEIDQEDRQALLNLLPEGLHPRNPASPRLRPSQSINKEGQPSW